MTRNLYQYFKPVQSLASFTKNPRLYREIRPSPDLRRHILCYWVLPAEMPENMTRSVVSETVVPDDVWILSLIFIVRQNMLHQIELLSGRDWATLACQYGYYDQAHFINEFTTFCGKSPSFFFK